MEKAIYPEIKDPEKLIHNKTIEIFLIFSRLH